jgi:hypothetical protein
MTNQVKSSVSMLLHQYQTEETAEHDIINPRFLREEQLSNCFCLIESMIQEEAPSVNECIFECNDVRIFDPL